MIFAVKIDEDALTISLVDRNHPRQAKASPTTTVCETRSAMVTRGVRTVSGLTFELRGVL